MSNVQPISALSTSEFNDATESSALLSGNTHTSSPQEEAPNRPATTTSSWSDGKNRSTFVLVLCTICILCIDAGLFLQMAPLTRIQESILCESYYNKHPDLEDFTGAIPEEMCKKIAAVQSSLALLKGWFALLDCIPGESPTTFKYMRFKTWLIAIKGYFWLFLMGLWPISMGERS
jgi:hypothetical protein